MLSTMALNEAQRSTVKRVVRYLPRRVNALRGRGDGLDVHDFMTSLEEARRAGVGDTDLGALFLNHQGRSVFKWTQYLGAYDEQFSPFRDGFAAPDGTIRPLRMLEIGVLDGGSLQIWRKYFGPTAIITGVDINPRAAAIDDPDIRVRIGSQDDPEFLRDVVAEMGGVDIVVDDGSHVVAHQRASFEILFPLLSDGGVYAVEDLHTSYWARWGGGYGRTSSFIELSKKLIDDMHGWYHEAGDRVGVGAVTQIPKITFYDSVMFVSKAQRARPTSVQFGKRLES